MRGMEDTHSAPETVQIEMIDEIVLSSAVTVLIARKNCTNNWKSSVGILICCNNNYIIMYKLPKATKTK